MSFVERRKYPRIEALYLLSYVNTEQGVQRTPVSLGRTLDISKGGVRVEVYRPVSVGSLMEMEVAVRDSLLRIRGSAVHVTEKSDRVFTIGIEFDKPLEDLEARLA